MRNFTTTTVKDVRDYTRDTLASYLGDGETILVDSVAIYWDGDTLSATPYRDQPSVAADGSDEIIWCWQAGDYDTDSEWTKLYDEDYGGKRSGIEAEIASSSCTAWEDDIERAWNQRTL